MNIHDQRYGIQFQRPAPMFFWSPFSCARKKQEIGTMSIGLDKIKIMSIGLDKIKTMSIGLD